jgi:hypothetical protein
MKIEPKVIAPMPAKSQRLLQLPIQKPVPRPPPGEVLPLFVQFADLRPEVIHQIEDYERARLIGKQRSNAQLLGIPDLVAQLVNNVVSESRKKPDSRMINPARLAVVPKVNMATVAVHFPVVL